MSDKSVKGFPPEYKPEMEAWLKEVLESFTAAVERAKTVPFEIDGVAVDFREGGEPLAIDPPQGVIFTQNAGTASYVEEVAWCFSFNGGYVVGRIVTTDSSLTASAMVTLANRKTKLGPAGNGWPKSYERFWSKEVEQSPVEKLLQWVAKYQSALSGKTNDKQAKAPKGQTGPVDQQVAQTQAQPLVDRKISNALIKHADPSNEEFVFLRVPMLRLPVGAARIVEVVLNEFGVSQ